MNHLVKQNFDDRAAPAPAGGTRRHPLRWFIEYLFWLFVLGSLAGGFALAILSPVLADTKAQAVAREESGFGRIVLTFDRLPSYENKLNSGIFVLSFGEPVEIDLAGVTSDLPEYVGLARRDPDGRAVRFALNRSFQINIMEAAEQLYVDILPPEWKGPPPPLPTHVIKELSRIAAEVERKAKDAARQKAALETKYELDVRLARHPTFSRIVFDWNKFTAVNLSRRAREVTVRFDEPAQLDLSKLKADPPKYLRDVQSELSADGLTVTLTIDDDVDVRGFREGLAYVVDLTGPDKAASEAVADAAAQAAGAGKEQTKFAARTEETAPRSRAKGETSAFEVRTAVFDPSEVVYDEFGDMPDVPPSAALESGDGKKPRGEQAAAAKPDSPPAPEVGPEGKITGPAQAEPEAKAVTAEEQAVPPAPAAAEAGSGAAVTVRAEERNGNLRLTFPFQQAVAAAAFRRGRTIWLVFDTDAKIDVAALKEAHAGKIERVAHEQEGSMQYLRLRLTRPWLTYIAKRKRAWVVDVGQMVTGEAQPLQLQRRLRADKRSIISVKLENPGHVHWLTDAEVGDRLAVVTAFGPPRSVAKPQNFVEFSALPTAHGIAIQSNSDDVAVRLQLDEVVITRRRGLTLSAGDAHQYMAGRKPLGAAGRVGFLDFAAWQQKSPGTFSDKVHEIQRVLASAPPGERNAHRMALARTYAANNYSAESLGVLERMTQTDPNVVADPAFNALRGAVLVQMGRVDEARKDFEVHALANDQDAALWLGILAAKQKEWNEALRLFDLGSDAITAYRPDFRAKFHLAAARAALELRKLGEAAAELEEIPEKELPKSILAEAQLLKGRYLERIGRTGEALELYDAALRSGVRPVVAEAELHAVSLLLQTRKISRQDALRDLERLQLVWRNDHVELGTLRLMADLYVKEAKYREAFTVMRNSLRTFPESDVSLAIQDDMKQVFEDLFLHGEGDKLSPFVALSLYYDFRELTPVGRLGDEMIRRLANRLISVDLLDQAGELLDHQVNKRLSGVARSQVATRLAMVHLMNHKPELALRIIRQTRQAGLPADLQRSRNLLEARALGELGRAESAIEILNTMDGPDVERLKADALWTSQRWQKAGEQIEKMLGSRWQEPQGLSQGERFDVLRAAIGYSLASDQFALDRLNKKFYEKMVQTPDADSFILVTKPIREKGVSFRELARSIAATNTLDGFMKEFRARYDKGTDEPRTSAKPRTGGAG